MRHVEHCMGTVFSIDVRDAGEWTTAITEVVAWLHHVDAVFSTYRADSDISRIRRRELRVDDADPDVGPVLDLCARAQAETGGAFSAMLGGAVDPTGIVKGWSIERASAILRRHGSANHAVNGGGDVQAAGEAEDGRPWGIGISDPAVPRGMVAVVQARDLAVATSGVAERGLHIVDPFTGAAAAQDVASATVVGPELTFADAYATAAVVLGREAVRWIEDVDGYELLLVLGSGERVASAGFHRHTG